MRRIAPAALLLAAVAVVSGCGGGKPKQNGEQSKRPQQIVADASAALSRVKSFHLEGSQTEKDGHMTVTGDVVLPGRIHVTVAIGDQTTELIAIDKSAYIKANAATWRKSAPKLARLFAGRWIKVPASAMHEFASLTSLATPAQIRRCFVTHPGKLVKTGTASFAGSPVVIVTDRGDRPGAEPGQLYVALRGDPLPLRFTQTGRQQPGGTPDKACNETSEDVHDTTTASDFRLSDFDEKVSIDPPPGALDVTRFGGSTV